MRILDIVWKDLRQTASEWTTPVFLIIMPIAFTIFFGIAFAGTTEIDPRVPVALINKDSGALSAWIVEAVSASQVVRIEDVVATGTDELKSLVLDETLAAAVVIPSGYNEAVLAQAEASTLTGAAADMAFVAWYAPSTQAGQAANNELQTILQRGLGAVKIASIAADVRAAARPFNNEAARKAFTKTALEQALAAWDSPAFTVESRMGGQREEEEQGLANSYAQSSPGMMIQFGITAIMGTASLIVIERKAKTLQRLLTTSVRRSEIIVAKLLAGFLQIFLQMVILTAFGQIFYDLPYYDHPLAILLISAAYAFTVASMGLLIGALARTEEAVIIMVMIPMFILSALGGAWFPMETMSEGMRLAGRVMTPTAWAMEGFQDIIVRGQGLEAVWLPAAIVAAWGIAFCALAIWRLRFTE